jgi:hypothetical protein
VIEKYLYWKGRPVKELTREELIEAVEQMARMIEEQWRMKQHEWATLFPNETR